MILQGEKIFSMPSFRGEVKLSVPCHRFAACKRCLNVPIKSAFRQKYRPSFLPTVPSFAARLYRVVWMWRHLVVEVGTSKPWGEGSHNKPIGCSVVSAGWQLTINAFSPAGVQFDIAKWEQQVLHSGYLSVQPMRRNKRLYYTNHQQALTDLVCLTSSSKVKSLAWETSKLKTEHNCYTITHNACQ
jgi:hypothetical protein